MATNGLIQLPQPLGDVNLFPALKGEVYPIRLRWEISSLENYVKSKMVPRGLRLKKTPGQNLKKSGGQEFIDKWNNILSECSLKLMQLMIDESTRKILQINKQVALEKRTLEEKKEDKQFAELNENVKKDLIKIQQEIKIQKKRKFIRDTDDYKKGQVYALQESQNSMSDSEQEVSEARYRKKYSKNGEKDRQGEQREKDGQIQLRDRTKWGVFVWEVFSKGKIPFEHFFNSVAVDKISAGLRLFKPKMSPERVYILMDNCCESTLAQLRNLTLPLSATSDFSEFAERWRNYAWRSAVKLRLAQLRILVNLPHRL
ncbi:hypothetical protein XELAEV_18038488mg [Xenopus laevis]|uniref:Serine-threonine/tyrosine-protein kinase catalytic domain-containing protein n=1 Tax=Xenopus laevis TaxID=8355 RepID=A0A974H7D1_XENLA|nr:hypothetical protein XELAEV_18038488mg [Xenopus laevis]